MMIGVYGKFLLQFDDWTEKVRCKLANVCKINVTKKQNNWMNVNVLVLVDSSALYLLLRIALRSLFREDL